MNWKTSSNPDQYILRPMRCHRLLSKSLCSKNLQMQKRLFIHNEKVSTKGELIVPRADLLA
jgi:hypothetical protein